MRAFGFDGDFSDGPFQLFNVLRRIADGQVWGRDFQAFAGIATNWAHLPVFLLAGADFRASEILRFSPRLCHGLAACTSPLFPPYSRRAPTAPVRLLCFASVPRVLALFQPGPRLVFARSFRALARRDWPRARARIALSLSASLLSQRRPRLASSALTSAIAVPSCQGDPDRTRPFCSHRGRLAFPAILFASTSPCGRHRSATRSSHPPSVCTSLRRPSAPPPTRPPARASDFAQFGLTWPFRPWAARCGAAPSRRRHLISSMPPRHCPTHYGGQYLYARTLPCCPVLAPCSPWRTAPVALGTSGVAPGSRSPRQRWSAPGAAYGILSAEWRATWPRRPPRPARAPMVFLCRPARDPRGLFHPTRTPHPRWPRSPGPTSPAFSTRSPS